MTHESWKFAVVGCDQNDSPSYLGFSDPYDGEAKLKENMKSLGWLKVAVFDSAFRELEVTVTAYDRSLRSQEPLGARAGNRNGENVLEAVNRPRPVHLSAM